MVAENIQQTLRAKYNPDGSPLRRQQMRMLHILSEIDRICKKHNISYWLSSGTLIGAVRHGGFIPWDDDLDIEMMRDDYDKLMSILPAELPPHLALQNHETDPTYFYFYAKIRDRQSILEEGNRYDRIWKEKGIYIDIFPLERQTIPLHRISEATVGHMYKVWRTSTDDKQSIKKVMRIFHFNRKYVFPLLRLLCRLSNTKVITSAMGIPYHNPRYEADIFPLATHTFEGHTFPVPRNYDRMLRLMYGNYMQLPPEENISTHCANLTFLDEP